MASDSGSAQFSIGAVIGSSFGVYARNFVSFSILALLIGAISLVLGLLMPQPTEAEMMAGQVSWGAIGLGAIAAILVNGLTQAAIIYGTFQDLRGQKAGIGDCIARGLATMIPVIVGSILLSLGIGIAALFLIIPGIILALMWWVYIPVIVVEGKGVMGSFGRSRELTRGRRWHILGLLIVVILLSVVASFIVGLVVGVAVLGGGGSVLVASILQYVVMSIVTAFSAILVAVGYYYLRAEKEGINIDDIARVFD
jgi:hypothetical protein